MLDDPSYETFKFSCQKIYNLFAEGHILLDEDPIDLPFYIAVCTYTPVGTKSKISNLIEEIVEPYEVKKQPIVTHQVYRSSKPDDF